ncbi:biotin/lipoyl-containing protein [Tianweitania sediminis]|uniref:Lipoyl-binding domain-containing protein n=1 Tax=Tianweitania sediminis TaxID=1502156 RepID=A0A8J7UJM0_9HYPH|nr:biotin/lipoyl-containing protein [Tianweitania sediminis]MBP0440193.1 hypothetical protein [Tianweitania sediminis]
MSIRLTVDGVEHHVTVARRKPHLVLLIDGVEHEVSRTPAIGNGRNLMAVGGRRVEFARAEVPDKQLVRLGGRTFEVGFVDPFSTAGGGASGADAVKAPMPGAIVSLQCAPGDSVTRGQPLVTIESMKLQTTLAAPRDGTIAAVLRSEGDTFEKDEVIVRLEPESEKV